MKHAETTDDTCNELKHFQDFLYRHFYKQLRVSSVNADLVAFTEETLNGKLHFLCSAKCFTGL